MACIGCEAFAKRITNIFRDEELKVKYAELTGFKILNDCFICDACNEKLEASYSFKQQCVEIYRKINPIFQQEFEIDSLPSEIEVKDGIAEERPELFIVGEENGSLIATEANEDEYLMATDEINDTGEQFENIYLEFEDDEEVESSPRRSQPSCERTVMSRKSYTVEEKLKIIDDAEKHSNRVTARKFNINESSVRCFRRQKSTLLKMNPQKKTNRRAFPHWPKLEEELKEFVINHPVEHGTKAKLKEIKQEAIKIAAKNGIEGFNGSNSYIFKFMTRHHLPSASPRPRKHKTGSTK